MSTMGGPAPLASANFATLEASQVVNALGMGADSTHLYYSNESPSARSGARASMGRHHRAELHPYWQRQQHPTLGRGRG